jgi:hypothetical protein
VVVFNPNGVSGDSPGQRPGFGIKLESQALKGRNDGTQRVRRDEVGVGHRALSGLGFLMGVVVPGRCPGLSHYAPLGRKTGAALEAIKLRDRNHRLATRGYVWSESKVNFVWWSSTPTG